MKVYDVILNSGSLQRRRASVLVVVLVVVALLSLGSYSFTQIMLGELKSTDMYERDVKSRAYADSGIELVAAVLGERTDEFSRPNLYDNPAMFQLLIDDAESARSRGSFSIIAPRENDNGTNPIRYGLVDESSKLNLNTIISFVSDEDAQQDFLLVFPNMTPDIADAILDWLDDDEKPRSSGAENEYYGTLYPPYEAKNGRLESLDELLRVRGVTNELLFGEDTNRNGLLDANENDGDATMPNDNADGILDRGWSAYLTVLSREANRRANGKLKVDVNQENLVALYDSVEEAFDSDKARFVAAYRLNGPDAEPGGDAGSTGGSRQPSGRRSSGNRQSSGRNGGGSRTAGGGETRGGLNLSQGGSQEINSLYDLVGATVTAEVNGTETKLESPWKDEPGSIAADLPTLLDRLTTSSEAFIEGRVNIAQAPREVLMAILDLEDEETASLVDAIIGAQVAGGSAAFDSGGPRATTGWLLAEGLIELEQMREIDPRITSRGDVYRVQSIGYFDAGGPATRLEAVIDATQTPPAIVSIRDLTDLGRGFSLQPKQP